MDPPPPPPPPHGSNTGGGQGSGLPPGKYDIFVIPPHSAGGGFLYLPSLQPHRNSFLAGVVSTLAVVGLYVIVFPVLKEWFITMAASGGAGVIMLMAGMGVIGWAWGKTQVEAGGTTSGSSAPGGGPGPGSGTNTGPNNGHNTYGNANGYAGAGGGFPNGSAHSPPPPGPDPSFDARPPPKSSWQRTKPANTSTPPKPGAWERAREEARKKEEERKKQEEIEKRAEELAKKKAEEEKERTRLREKEARERKEREEKRAKERAEREKMKTPPPSKAPPPPPSARSPSPKKPPQPSARTEADEDTYSYRPYDKVKTAHTYKSSSPSSIYSGSSYQTHSTARTSPPPSVRGPYSTKDPDKIIIKAVYAFNNAFNNMPIAQLISGKGSVTDGLILRMTTEGLFIDDDVRGVPQREWDVKAWTMKLVEVWCPQLQALGASSGSNVSAQAAGRSSFFGTKHSSKAPTSEESDAFLAKFKPLCRSNCGVNAARSSARSASSWDSQSNASMSQTGELKGLHVVRATIRDQEGKRYVFILTESEAWKVAVGLQRLRKGSQVRALGVSGMPTNETKAILSNMGFL